MINIKQFEEIINGWKNLITQSDDTIEEIAKQRIAICVDCEHLSKRNSCKLCGCYMPAKTRSLKSKCVENKW